MTSFAVMRVKKIKGGASITGSIAHITRARETPNADPELRHLNRAVIGEDNAKAIRDAIASRTPERYRRDAVRSLEFVLTASPDWFVRNSERTDEYLDAAVEWVKSELGEDNVVSAVIHYDETTPHVHVHAVPLVEETGKLSAKSFIDGRGDLSRMQSRFATWQSDFGVQRGKPKAETKRKHTTIQEWQQGHSQLDERESSLSSREHDADAKLEQAKAQAVRLDDRETALAERERQHLTQRSRLSDREKSLVPREQGLDQREATLLDWESRKSEWIAEYEPKAKALDERETRVAALEARVSHYVESQRPKPLTDAEKASLRFAAMPQKQRIDAMSDFGMKNPELRDDIRRLGWVSYDTGDVTPEGQAALERHGGAGQKQERRQEQWQTLDLPSSGPSL